VPARDNGLRASRYTALLDLEPQLADAMLDALREQGVAAYAAAASGVSGPYLDVHLPDRPKDRLWVDTEAIEQARSVLHATLPGLREEYAAIVSDEDAAWQAIVAGYDLTSPDPPSRGQSRLLRGIEPEQPPASAQPAPQAEPPPAPDDHYQPPPPPPLPATDTVTKLAWAGVVGGPAYLFLGTVAGRGLSERAAVLAVAAFVAGFVTLVARMKDRPPTDSGPDDGAVV